MIRRLIFFLITALIAVLMMMLINSALRSKQATIEALQHGRTDIVVAARNLTPGTAIDATSVKLVPWPREALPPGALSDPKQVQGQVTTQSVIENQPIVAAMLLERGKSGGVLPFLIPSGMRAMSIPVTPVSDMAGMILPHTRVDVLVTCGEGSGPSDRTRIVLQNEEVVAVQTTLENSGNEPQHAEVVTLLVTPGDAERLAAATRLGTLQVAMRSYGDQQIAWTPGVNSRELLGLPDMVPAPQESPASALPKPPVIRARRDVAAPKPQISVEIIRNGKQRQTVTFAQSGPVLATPGTNAVDP
jgi:pilus assembly protein CpaB